MDGRLLTATESMMRNLYKLNDSYYSKSCNVKAGTIEMEMSNGIINLKAKFPRDLIESNLECADNAKDSEDEEIEEEPTDELVESSGDIPDEEVKVKKKVLKKGAK